VGLEEGDLEQKMGGLGSLLSGSSIPKKTRLAGVNKNFFIIDEEAAHIYIQPTSKTKMVTLQERKQSYEFYNDDDFIMEDPFDLLASLFTSETTDLTYYSTYVPMEGDSLTVFGHLKYSQSIRSWVIEAPKMITSTSRYDLLNYFKEEKEEDATFRTIYGFFLAVCLIMWCSIGRQAWRTYSIYRAQMREYERYRVPRVVIDDYKCIVCFDRARDVIYRPCSHCVCCKLCTNSLQNRKCPVCNKAIEDEILIYFS